MQKDYNYTISEYSRKAIRFSAPVLNSWDISERMKGVVIAAARKQLLDYTDFLAERMDFFFKHLSSLKKVNKVYLYLGLGSKALFGAFCFVGNSVKSFNKVIDSERYRKLRDESKKYSVIISEHYASCFDLSPTEFFFIYDPASKELECFETVLPDKGKLKFEISDYKMRFNAWFRAYGGNPKPVSPYTLERVLRTKLEFWLKFCMSGENNQLNYPNPAVDAVELDLEAIRKEVSLAMEADQAREAAREEERARFAMVPGLDFEVERDYLEGDTGFMAIKNAFCACYPCDGSPAFLCRHEVDDLRGKFKLIRKDFESTLYEYIAVFADDDCNCWHVVSLGMSGLRAERDTTHKRYDAEYTMRIRCLDDEDMDEAEWANAINLVSILADEACNKERMAEDYSYVSLGFRKGMDYKRESDKVAFIIVPDARIGSVEGPFGTVHLRQAVPITRAEHQALKAKQIDVKTLYEKIGTDLTDYSRPSVI